MVAAKRAWQNFNDLESYDFTMLFPQTTEHMIDPNHNLLWNVFGQTSLAKLFNLYAENLSRFLFSFSMSIDSFDLFSSQDEKKDFFAEYQCDDNSMIVPLSWEELRSNLSKVTIAHKNTLFDGEMYDAIIQLQNLFSWNLFDCFGNHFSPTSCGWISSEDLALSLAPVTDIFGEKTVGLIDLVMLYLVLVKKSWRTICVDGMPHMFINNALTRLMMTRTHQKAKSDDLSSEIVERFFRFYVSLNEKLYNMVTRDSYSRLDIAGRVMRAQDHKIKELVASTKLVEYTNPYTWT